MNALLIKTVSFFSALAFFAALAPSAFGRTVPTENPNNPDPAPIVTEADKPPVSRS